MGEKLKFSEADFSHFILNFSDYENAFLYFQELKYNTITFLWLFFLIIFSLLSFTFPNSDKLLLFFMIIGALSNIKLIPFGANLILETYLSFFNKDLSHKILMYSLYSVDIKRNMLITLYEGSDNNFVNQIIKKTL